MQDGVEHPDPPTNAANLTQCNMTTYNSAVFLTQTSARGTSHKIVVICTRRLRCCTVMKWKHRNKSDVLWIRITDCALINGCNGP